MSTTTPVRPPFDPELGPTLDAIRGMMGALDRETLAERRTMLAEGIPGMPAVDQVPNAERTASGKFVWGPLKSGVESIHTRIGCATRAGHRSIVESRSARTCSMYVPGAAESTASREMKSPGARRGSVKPSSVPSRPVAVYAEQLSAAAAASAVPTMPATRPSAKTDRRCCM